MRFVASRVVITGEQSLKASGGNRVKFSGGEMRTRPEFSEGYCGWLGSKVTVAGSCHTLLGIR